MEFVEKTLKSLKYKIIAALKKNRIEDALCLITSMAKLEYSYNQKYNDIFLENILNRISKMYSKKINHTKDDKNVLFYDGFGLDSRGLAQIYIKALVQIGYTVIYVTEAREKKMQPQTLSLLKDNITINYSGKNNLDKIEWLSNIFSKYKFSNAFFYTTPWDAPGCIAFNQLKSYCRRYLINLTDHAFWLGLNSFDFLLEFRNYGAAISRDFRKVNPLKIINLPYYPIVNYVKFKGFPFDEKNKKVIFSGGSIYKTKDKFGTFFSLVENVVTNHPEVIFLYASNGTSEQLENLIKKYPNQVYRVNERNDLIEIMRHSYLYLNTYPISGALMLQYAALGKCIPITLRRPWDDDTCGILRNEELLDEVFESVSSINNEINKLLSDNKYYLMKKNNLNGQVISDFEFTKELNDILLNPQKHTLETIKSVDTSKFVEWYKENLSNKDVIDAVINKNTIRNIVYFPTFIVLKLLYILNKKIKYVFCN